MDKMKRTPIDDAAAEIFDAAIESRGLTNKGIERLSGGEIGYNRVRDIRIKQRGPIRLSELIALCGAIGLDPATTLRQVVARADDIETAESASPAGERRPAAGVGEGSTTTPLAPLNKNAIPQGVAFFVGIPTVLGGRRCGRPTGF